MKNIVILLLPLFILVLVACSAPEPNPSLPGTVEAEVRRPAAAVSTSTPLPLPAAETMPIPYRLEKYEHAAYTIEVPDDWLRSVDDTEGMILGEAVPATLTQWTPAGTDVAAISVVSAQSVDGGWEFDVDTYADVFLNTLESNAVAGTFDVFLREAVSRGRLTIYADYQEPGRCTATSVAEFYVLPEWLFIVEASYCRHRSFTYSDRLFESFNSFAPTALGQK